MPISAFCDFFSISTFPLAMKSMKKYSVSGLF